MGARPWFLTPTPAPTPTLTLTLTLTLTVCSAGFELVAHQLSQLYAAVSLARLLNRTLILPRMVCTWATHTQCTAKPVHRPSVRCGPRAPCVVPQVCGDRLLAFPCRAWYHRPWLPGQPVWRVKDKLPMPSHCPLHYWLDVPAISKQVCEMTP